MSKEQNLVSILESQFGFWESSAIAFIESEGRCVYCDEDLYSNRIRYASLNVEHLFPQSEFPKLAREQSNLVISCFKCNNHKRSKPLHPKTDNPLSLLKSDKQAVINHIREKLQEQIKNEISICEKLNNILPWVEQ